MECRFLTNGIAVSYDHVLKPCCEWQVDATWKKINLIKNANILNWHQSSQVVEARSSLESGTWPSNCKICQYSEQQGRGDSVRLGGNRAYQHFNHSDITLEIRPGNVCNFACQSCWPEASTRVAQFYQQADLIKLNDIDSQSIDDFEFLLPIADKIKNVVLLGGEPFYDKNCKRFLSWANDNLSADITMFTNGSSVDFEFIANYTGHLTIVFSIDAIGPAAEYVRYGTDWNVVFENYKRLLEFTNVEVRVNVTATVYNYVYLESLIELLLGYWPSIVTFGHPRRLDFREYVVPLQHRPALINSLVRSQQLISASQLVEHQKQNSVSALQTIITNLEKNHWDQENYKKLVQFIDAMDRVKHINIVDYCPELASMLLIKID
jgi:hypothetical protein